MDRGAASDLLDRSMLPYAACAVSAALGLCFVFVWAPHPWGWEGIDHYHDLALDIARGRGFQTLDVPWGYAYFLAAFYRLAGDRPWIPLVFQALLNATIPLLVFAYARTWLGARTARVAAVLTGVCSFNTVYASTQSSDAICTFLFTAAVVAFARARASDGLRWYAVVGVLTGLASQFRPNLVLIPLLLATLALLERPTLRRAAAAVTLAACAATVAMPWIVRNYRLTRTILPTSVHGGVQLWYGSLQVGPYLTSRAYNPKSVFETPVFDYTSLEQVPIIVTATARGCAPAPTPVRVSVVYWTDRSPVPRAVVARLDGRRIWAELPAVDAPTVVYYYLTATWSVQGQPQLATSPRGAGSAPFTYFVSQNHLGDLDVHDDLLDLFDLMRVMRFVAWRESSPRLAAVAAAGLEQDALEPVVSAIMPRWIRLTPPFVSSFTHDDRLARLELSDGSTIVIPRRWRERITDVEIKGTLAADLMASTISLASLRHRLPPPTLAESCSEVEDLAVNRLFYRREPHMMRRYMALALDNIARAPGAFLVASAYRAVRLFVVLGTDDRSSFQQFRGSRLVYAGATILSMILLALFVSGAFLEWRRGGEAWVPLLLIAYVPVTIAPFLTNMRYTVTVQPLVFMFVAAALTALLSRRHESRSLAPPLSKNRDRAATSPSAR